VADCVPFIVPIVACSLIFCCLCAIMSKRRACGKDHDMSRRAYSRSSCRG